MYPVALILLRNKTLRLVSISSSIQDEDIQWWLTPQKRRLISKSTALACAVLLTLVGCSQETPEIPTPYRVVTDIHRTMELILDPAAEHLWSSAGSIISSEGETDLSPTSDEGWHKVERSAAVLAETGNLLMMPVREAGADWIKFSQELIDTGELAMKAAMDQDRDALFDAGGRIYEVCLACHSQYWAAQPVSGSASKRKGNE
ncbi:MAG: hypothetical protein ACJAUG_000088 [Halioglobus sp.]